MKKTFLFIVVCLMGLVARGADEPAMTVLLADGTQMEFRLSEKPQMLWEDGYVHFTTATTTVAVAQAQFRGFTMSGATAIRELNNTPGRIVYGRDGRIVISGLHSQSDLSVYDTAGRQVAADITPKADDTVEVNLSALPSGIYVIHVNHQSSFKVVKP